MHDLRDTRTLSARRMATGLSLLLLSSFGTLHAQDQPATADAEDDKIENAVAAQTSDDCEDRYPTAVIADYVLACMAANGNTYESLHQCSCSIDVIQAKMPYDEYERINTIMQIQLDKGQRGIFYREAAWATSRIDAFKQLQAESTLACF